MTANEVVNDLFERRDVTLALIVATPAHFEAVQLRWQQQLATATDPVPPGAVVYTSA